MTEERKQILVIYHGWCMDGWVAAWSAWRKFGDGAEYLPANREPGENFDVDGRDVYILDYCPSRSALESYATRAKSLTVLDHHQSSQDLCAGLDYCHFDMNRSGAGMAWDWFHPGVSRSQLVCYVEDRDIWTWKLKDSQVINTALQGHSLTDFSLWSSLDHELNTVSGLDYLSKAGAAVERSRRVDINNYKRSVILTTFAGYENVPVVNASGIIVSDLLNELAGDDYFAVSWHQMTADRFKYSLRSRGDFDVAKLAEKANGGGHKHAAAFVSIFPPWLLSDSFDYRVITDPELLELLVA